MPTRKYSLPSSFSITVQGEHALLVWRNVSLSLSKLVPSGVGAVENGGMLLPSPVFSIYPVVNSFFEDFPATAAFCTRQPPPLVAERLGGIEGRNTVSAPCFNRQSTRKRLSPSSRGTLRSEGCSEFLWMLPRREIVVILTYWW